MNAAIQLGEQVGLKRACEALAVPRATLYRHRAPPVERPPRPRPARSLGAEERAKILEVLHSERFRDQSVAETYGALLSEGTYLASKSTMYRVLRAVGETRERRDQRRHPSHAVPRLEATGPNQVWTWDITKLRGPQRGRFFYLYVVLDLYSRFVVAWMLAKVESAEHAEKLLQEAYTRQGVTPGTLTVHADRGAPMTSRMVTELLAELGVSKSSSRPRVSNDNAFSEAQFKTVKHNPWYPGWFEDITDARAYCRELFGWYNDEHHHSGIAGLPPRVVHEGRGAAVLAERQKVLDAAYARHPERFVRGRPSAGALPERVCVNPAPTTHDMTGDPQREEVP